MFILLVIKELQAKMSICGLSDWQKLKSNKKSGLSQDNDVDFNLAVCIGI